LSICLSLLHLSLSFLCSLAFLRLGQCVSPLCLDSLPSIALAKFLDCLRAPFEHLPLAGLLRLDSLQHTSTLLAAPLLRELPQPRCTRLTFFICFRNCLLLFELALRK
jgi:hypothetical protein